MSGAVPQLLLFAITFMALLTPRKELFTYNAKGCVDSRVAVQGFRDEIDFCPLSTTESRSVESLACGLIFIQTQLSRHWRRDYRAPMTSKLVGMQNASDRAKPK
jgi:hypothetical protein